MCRLSFLLFPDTFLKVWKVGKLEGEEVGRLERWMVRRLEGWKVQGVLTFPLFPDTFGPSRAASFKSSRNLEIEDEDRLKCKGDSSYEIISDQHSSSLSFL